MKSRLPYRSLSEREVPSELDKRILERAARRCRQSRSRRKWFFLGGIAAACCLVAFSGVIWQIREERSLEHRELLALGDFSRLDQSGFNISSELACNGDWSAY